MNSWRKGEVGEREFAVLLCSHGFDARRDQQFNGSPDSLDMISNGLPWLHVEVKRVQNLNLTDACMQAEGDCGDKARIVAQHRNHAPWLIAMRAEPSSISFVACCHRRENRNMNKTKRRYPHE